MARYSVSEWNNYKNVAHKWRQAAHRKKDVLPHVYFIAIIVYSFSLQRAGAAVGTVLFDTPFNLLSFSGRFITATTQALTLPLLNGY